MMDIIVNDITEAIRSEITDIKVKAETADAAELEVTSAKIKMLKDRIEKLKAKQDALWEKYAEGMPKQTFERLLAKNESDMAEAEDAVQKTGIPVVLPKTG